MPDLRRRDALRLTLGGAPLVVFGCSTDPGPPPTSGDELPTETVEEIAAWVLSIADFAAAVEDLRGRLDEGTWTPDAVFAGTLLAGARTVDSRYGGSGFHAVLQIEALRHFGHDDDEADLLDALVYAIVRVVYHRSDPFFELPAVDLASLPPPEGADAVLLDAVDASAVDEATRACVALFRAGDIARLHDALLELGPRRAHKLGHEAICTAKVLTALVALPGSWSEDVYRAIVWALVTQEAPAGPENTELWDQSRERVLVLPSSWTSGAENVERVAEVAVALRETLTADEAVGVVEAAIESGLGPRSIWDGLVLAAAESAYGGSNYHALTSVQALRDGDALASTDRVRLLLLLQAAVFIGLDHAIVGPGAPLLETQAAPQTLDEAFAEDRSPGVTRALGYLQATGDRDGYVRGLRALMHARASDEHHVKIPHAVLLEAERLPDRFVPFMLACARLFAPSQSDPYGQVWELLHSA